MAHDSGLDDEAMAGGTPDDDVPLLCRTCKSPAAVVMTMATANQQWCVGEWPLCEYHAYEALGAAGVDATEECIDFDDTPPEELEE